MRYCVLLSGEHDDLPRAEALAVIDAESSSYNVVGQRGRLLLVDVEDTFTMSRLAMAHEVGEVLCETRTENIDAIRDAVPEFDGTFAVRARNAGSDNEAMEREIGAIVEDVSGQSVDLSDPDIRFQAHFDQDRLIFYRVVEDIDTGVFEERRSHLRPFSSPVSLHPKLARAMVNLAGVQAGDGVADPMCGTGGILLEAGLMGMNVYGSDIEKEMVRGCRENLDAFGVDGTIKCQDIRSFTADWGEDVDAVVSDLPYGRASPKEGDDIAETFLQRSHKICDGRIVVMTDREEMLGRKPDFSMYVHRSLSRHLYVFQSGAESLRSLEEKEEVIR